jgi:hypothetical protein
MRLHSLHRSIDRRANVSIRGTQRLSRAREFQQRLDQIGHLIDGNPYLGVKIFALIRRQVAFAKKFRIRHDRRQRMPQIVRDRTRHPPNRRQPFRIEQFALRFLQVLSHPVESSRNLGNLVSAPQCSG